MIECRKFKSYEKGSLLGFADLYFSNWGIEVLGCSVYQKNGHMWVNLPSKEFKNEAGETKYTSVIKFSSKNQKIAFEEQATQAVKEKMNNQ